MTWLRWLVLLVMGTLVMVAPVTAAKKAGGTVRLNYTGGTLKPGETLQLTGQPLDKQGNPVAGVVTWRSSSPSTANVAADGLVTAVAPGLATITGSSGKRKGTALINVIPPPVPGAAFPAVVTDAQINHVLTDDGVLFWSEADGKITRIRRMDIAGGPITDVVQEAGKDKRGVGIAYVHLAALGDELFYTRNISGVATHTSIRRIPKDGGASAQVLPEDTAQEPFRPSLWRLSGQYLVVSLRKGNRVGLSDAVRVAAFDTVAGTWSPLITGSFTETKVFILAANDAWVHVRALDVGKTKIVRLQPNGGNNTFETLVTQDGTDDDLGEAGASDDTNVYLWSRKGAEHKLQSLPVGGTDPTILTTGNFGPGLAVAGPSLFWIRDVTATTGRLLSLPTGGGAPGTLRDPVQSLVGLGGVAATPEWAFAVEKGLKKQQKIIQIPLP